MELGVKGLFSIEQSGCDIITGTNVFSKPLLEVLMGHLESTLTRLSISVKDLVNTEKDIDLQMSEFESTQFNLFEIGLLVHAAITTIDEFAVGTMLSDLEYSPFSVPVEINGVSTDRPGALLALFNEFGKLFLSVLISPSGKGVVAVTHSFTKGVGKELDDNAIICQVCYDEVGNLCEFVVIHADNVHVK